MSSTPTSGAIIKLAMLTRLTRFSLALFVVGLAVPFAAAQQPSAGSVEMASSAQAFLAALDQERRAQAVFPFSDEERFNFHFIPRPRKGLPLNAMNLEQRRAAHALLRSALSSRGYLKATSVMQLENVLDAIEASGPVRDPELYFVSVFGSPGDGEPWGWRFEGHHLSLNYVSVTNELSATTPAFFGANPAEVRLGPMAGLRVLAAEEDIARRLMSMLDAEQRAEAIIAEDAPREIITGADREARLDGFEGLPGADMTDAQRDVLWQIVLEYTNNMRQDLAERQIEKIRQAGVENLYFAWAGSQERGEGHYYRIHGPTVLFEYDNTQNDANHVHAMWRDLQDDFGVDLLRQHYEEQSHD